MATELAQAYVQIVPSAEGIKGKIGEALGDEPEKAGEKAGNDAGHSFGASMAKGIATAAAAVTGAAIALVKGVIDGAKETANFGDVIDKTSQKLGLSASAYQEWDYVMNLAGTDMQSMTTGLKTLTNKLDDAKNGSESAQAMFAALGISMDEINTMSREDLFGETIKGFQGMADSTERAALANDLFGRSGQDLTPLFNQSAEATQEQIERAREYGMVMSDDLVKASAAFVDSQTTLKNTLGGLKNRLMGEFLPALTDVTDGLAAFLAGDDSGLQTMQKGIEGFISSLTDNLPKVMEFGGGVLQAIAQGIIQNLPALFQSATKIVMDLATFLLQNLPLIVQAGMDLIVNLAAGISEAIPTLLPTIVQVVLDVANMIIQNLPTIVQAGLDILLALVQGIIEALPIIVEQLPVLVQSVVDALIECTPMLIECATTLVTALVQALPQIIVSIIEILPTLIESVVTGLIECLPQLISAAVQLTIGVVKALPQIFVAVVTALVKLVVELAGKIRDKWVEFKKAAGEWISKIWSGIQEKWGTLIQNIVKFFRQIPQKIGDALRNIGEVGKNLVKGLWNGITNVTSWVLDKIKGFGKSILNGIKKIFGIGSPSKEMAYFGEMLDAGLAMGIEDNTKPITNAIDDITTMTSKGFSSTVGVSSALDVNHTTSGMEQLVSMVAALAEKVDHLQVYLDGDLLVGGISDRMDTALGTSNVRKARGLA